MRGYYVPVVAGTALIVSTFLPWVQIGDLTLRGVPDVAGLWVLGLGVLAVVLATLSLITRKNSRHPLLLVGLVALGIMFLSYRAMPRSVGERALTLAQATAIVDDVEAEAVPAAMVGSGIYLGLGSALAIVGFGMTIVFKKAVTPYVVTSPDDDVP